MKRVLISILFLVLWGSLHAQISFGYQVEKDSMTIGDINTLTINIISPDPSLVKGYSIDSLNFVKPSFSLFEEDNLENYGDSDFEVLDLDTKLPVTLSSANFVKQANGTYLHQNTSRFKVWDVGVYSLPSLILELDTSRGRNINVMPLEQDFFVVKPPEVSIQDTVHYIAPIMPIISEQKTWEDWMWLVYLLLGLLLAALVIYFILRRKKRESLIEEEVIIIRPSHEVAFEKLDELESKKLWQEGKVKEYQTELTYTIREYLENRFGIQALESTTGEINKSLKEVDFDQKHTSNLNNILQIADMVKFAKAKPEESIHQEFMDKARSFVKDTLFIQTEEDDELVD